MGKRNKRNRRRRRDNDDDNIDNSDNSEDEDKTAAGLSQESQQSADDKKWPTHFLAVRITDLRILQTVKQLQDHLVNKDPLLKSCCMPPPALHITVCNLGLETLDQVDLAKDFLEQKHAEIATCLPRGPLHLKGMSHFDNQVLYANVNPPQEFNDFVDHVKGMAKEAGLEVRDNHNKFVPHVTLLKVSYPMARQRNSWTVKPCLYSDFTDIHFGDQPLDAICLCCMGGNRREDGFYVCPSEIHFGRT